MSKTAYIAGKISGLPKAQIKEKFDRAASELSEQGYDVVVPQPVANKTEDPKPELRSSIKQMLDCDEVHLLPGWQESRGAQLQRDIAIRLGMNVIYH